MSENIVLNEDSYDYDEELPSLEEECGDYGEKDRDDGPCSIYVAVKTPDGGMLSHHYKGCYSPDYTMLDGLPCFMYKDENGETSTLAGPNMVISIVPENTKTTPIVND